MLNLYRACCMCDASGMCDAVAAAAVMQTNRLQANAATLGVSAGLVRSLALERDDHSQQQLSRWVVHIGTTLIVPVPLPVLSFTE